MSVDRYLYLFSRNIFSKSGELDSLLVGGGEEEGRILELVGECVEEREPGQRWKAVDTLVGILSGEQRTTGWKKLQNMFKKRGTSLRLSLINAYLKYKVEFFLFI